jgi:uncharacterized OB-fold protein
MIRLQRCADCGVARYPASEFCGACLSDLVGWESADSLPARVLGRTRLCHSNEPGWRSRLPLTCGLVRLDAGPTVVCFLTETAEARDVVRVLVGANDLLEAG